MRANKRGNGVGRFAKNGGVCRPWICRLISVAPALEECSKCYVWKPQFFYKQLLAKKLLRKLGLK